MQRRAFLVSLFALCACASTPEDNLARSAAFLRRNARAAGVRVTTTGLQYRVVTGVADGVHPRATDFVTVRYEGRFPDGREFDSSTDPIEFRLNRVIRGWTEGLQLMSPGETYEFFIPPSLAYGERGTGNGTIPPNQVLVFRVELISVRGAP